MDFNAILSFFELAAETGHWEFLYNSKNPHSYSFIARLQKSISLVYSFKNKKVLDLGCGTGILMPFVIHDSGEYTGLDVSVKMLGEIKKNYPEYVDRKDVHFVFGDVKKVTLPDSIDTMIGLGFIEYFDNPEELIQKLYLNLPKGGRLILSFPNSCSLDYFCIKLLTPCRYLGRMLLGKSTNQPPRILWSIKNAKNLFHNSGFKNIRTMNYNVNIFAYPLTKISAQFTNFWAKRFEYGVLSKCSFFATGFLIYGEK